MRARVSSFHPIVVHGCPVEKGVRLVAERLSLCLSCLITPSAVKSRAKDQVRLSQQSQKASRKKLASPTYV